MKIGLQTWGSDGDIRPFLALAGGLQRAGHEVSLVVTSIDNKDYSRFSEEFGFALRHVGKLDFSESELKKGTKKLFDTKLPIKEVQMVIESSFDPLIDVMFAASMELCEANDLLIGHYLHHPAMAAAEKTGTPYTTAILYHGGIPSRYTTPAGCPDIGKWANPFWWQFGDFLVNNALRGRINKLRAENDLKPVKNVIKEVWATEKLNLVAVSSALCKVQPDWHPAYKVCGFFDMKKCDEKWEIPADLREFLNDGPPPVYLTFGSMISVDPAAETITELLLESARKAGCRAIIQSKWSELKDFPDHPEIYKIESAPHQHIFPHCSIIVHHGGAGTTQTALRHGCPSVVVEHFGDQLFWANELHRIGVSPKPLHRRDITADKLANALRSVQNSPEMSKKAKAVAEVMHNEDGVQKAIQFIEKSFDC